jgi:hypothetical protein
MLILFLCLVCLVAGAAAGWFFADGVGGQQREEDVSVLTDLRLELAETIQHRNDLESQNQILQADVQDLRAEPVPTKSTLTWRPKKVVGKRVKIRKVK